MQEESWRRNHGGGIMEEQPWRRNHGRGNVEAQSTNLSASEHGYGQGQLNGHSTNSPLLVLLKDEPHRRALQQHTYTRTPRQSGYARLAFDLHVGQYWSYVRVDLHSNARYVMFCASISRRISWLSVLAFQERRSRKAKAISRRPSLKFEILEAVLRRISL